MDSEAKVRDDSLSLKPSPKTAEAENRRQDCLGPKTGAKSPRPENRRKVCSMARTAAVGLPHASEDLFEHSFFIYLNEYSFYYSLFHTFKMFYIQGVDYSLIIVEFNDIMGP